VAEPQTPHRAETREITELRRVRDQQPELASAVDLQIELLQLHRRIQSRVRLPSIRLESEYLNSLLAAGPVLQFEHLPIDFGDLRFLLRAVASAMRTQEAIDDADFRKADALCLDAALLPPAARSWYEAPRKGAAPLGRDIEGLEPVFQQAMRPFLMRAAEALMAKMDLSTWGRGSCPLCAGEADFAVITAAADRLLICSRCAARWHFHQIACPYCANADRARITSFASRDRQYRIYGCDVCQRYLKAFDARHASRPVMPAVDSVATLPLDAAAMQRGYK